MIVIMVVMMGMLNDDDGVRDGEGDSGSYVSDELIIRDSLQVLQPEEAVEHLMEHWNSILLDQLNDISARADEDMYMPDVMFDSLGESEDGSVLSTYESY